MSIQSAKALIEDNKRHIESLRNQTNSPIQILSTLISNWKQVGDIIHSDEMIIKLEDELIAKIRDLIREELQDLIKESDELAHAQSEWKRGQEALKDYLSLNDEEQKNRLITYEQCLQNMNSELEKINNFDEAVKLLEKEVSNLMHHLNKYEKPS